MKLTDSGSGMGEASVVATRTPVPNLGIMRELEETPARNLDKFIENHLLPDTNFRRQIKEAVHIISTFLKEKCFQGFPHPVRVTKVIKGGSSGKGTSLRGRSDADLVVFLSNLGSFQEQLYKRGEFIWEIKRQLEACQREEVFEVRFEVGSLQWEKPRALSFWLTHPYLPKEVEFDVLPAFDVLGQWTNNGQPNPEIYITLIRECQVLGKEGEFSTCFTELQRDFLRQRPTKVKSLIRLVKYWFQKCKEKLGKPLPQQYALELLTVYAWEQGSKETEFSTAQGFQTVLKLVLNYQQLCIYWTKYYNFENPTIRRYLERQLAKRRPVILDPADPTGNVAGRDSYPWRRLADEARAWLSYPCFKKGDGSPVGSWDVPLAEDIEDSWATREHRMYSPEAYGWHPVVAGRSLSAAMMQSTAPKEEDWACAIL
ncbi:2'-5'-oligoadenylate synthase 1 isoform X1 [Meles meles]|uniref:2'-5'-oligoadenylate synthase 1 isoform X1 n=1 Tax=Meles meles TaxID=9662 RepID=UPI001E6A09FA|nr:2'-5'-oligoadenylate synthase 1 isoform X1 [Meles meles]